MPTLPRWPNTSTPPPDNPDRRRWRSRLSGASSDEQLAFIVARLGELVAAHSGSDAASIDPNREWRSPHRLLSLVQPTVLRELALPLYDCDVPHCRCITSLAEHIVRERQVPPMPRGPMAELYEPTHWAWDVPQHAPVKMPAADPIFVLSAPRSGSTLLRAMLGRHSALFAPPELHLIGFQTMKRRRKQTDALGYQWMRRGLISAFVGHRAGLVRALQIVAALERDDCPIGAAYASLMEAATGKTLVDKTPTYAFHPRWVLGARDLFPSARFIHLVRHPPATIRSFVRMRFGRLFGPHWLVWDANSWRYGEKCWTSCNLHICDGLDDVPSERRLLVRYEDLVTDTEGQLRRLCHFIGVAFEPAMLTPYRDTQEFCDRTTRGAVLGDPDFLNHDAVEPLHECDAFDSSTSYQLADVTHSVADRLRLDNRSF